VVNDVTASQGGMCSSQLIPPPSSCIKNVVVSSHVGPGYCVRLAASRIKTRRLSRPPKKQTDRLHGFYYNY
jgi:hypothetical protein